MLIFYLPLTSSWRPEDTLLLDHLSPQRRDKVLRYRQTSDRRLCLYAALVLGMGLSRLSGLPPSRLSLDCPRGKKPTCPTLPSCDFNLSHTKGALLCCIAESEEEGKVGCDIEGITLPPWEIMPRIFHPQEIAYIQPSAPISPVTSGAAKGPEERFFEIWTRKEAYVKQLGTGLTDHLNCLSLLADPPSAFLHTWREDSYICSVASHRPWAHPPIQHLEETDLWAYYLEGKPAVWPSLPD